MPRRYKRVRFRRKRKRYSRRRSGRKSFNFRVKKIAARLDNASRLYLDESRTSAIETTQNTIQYKMLPGIGAAADCDKIIGASMTGLNYTDLGDVNNLTISGGDKYKHMKWDFTNWSKTYHFRNIDEHEQYLTIYEITLKKNMVLNGNNMCEMVIDAIDNGWADYIASGAASTSTDIQGQNLWTQTSNTVLDVNSTFLKPTDSHAFNSHFKIIRQKTFKLNPGDDVFWTMRVRNRIYNYKDHVDSDETTYLYNGFKGYTKCLMARLSGVMGRSNAAGEADVIGLMQTDTSIAFKERCRILPMAASKRASYAYLTQDDLTGKTLVGPTDDAHLDDAN